MRALAQTAPDDLRSALATEGLLLDLGAASLCVRSPSAVLAAQLGAVYAGFPFQRGGDFADLHVEIAPPGNWRRFARPQVVLRCDGEQPFQPFPADSPLPLMEWGTNWLIGQRLHHLLLLHAGCLERDGLGLLLPATPGSGKSTLTAALAQRGWRLLSDEFGVCDPASGRLHAMLKPVALKNESIAVIRRFAPQARLGPEFPGTRKGTVAHVAAGDDAVRRRGESAAPAVVVLPKWTVGSATTLEPLADEDLFSALAFNAFNYEVLGATGFRTVLRLVRRCRGWRLVYSDLEDAIARLDAMWTAGTLGGEKPLPAA